MKSVYLIAPATLGPVKVGVSINPKRRLREIQFWHWKELLLHRQIKLGAGEAFHVEAAFKRHFEDCQLLGEWYDTCIRDAEEWLSVFLKKKGFIEIL